MRRVLLASLSIGLVSPARADEALDRAKQRYQAGVEHYKAGRYDEAAKELEAAYALKPISRFLVDLARTHVKKGDKVAALKYAKQFLHETRMDDTERPAVEQLVKDLEAEVGEAAVEEEMPAPMEVPGVEPEEGDEPAAPGASGAKPGRPRKPRRPGASAATLIHTPIDDAKVGRSVPIVAELPGGVEAARVILRYRDAGRGDWTNVNLEEQGYAFIGEIPGRRVLSSSVQYYLEARDAAGKPVALSGNPYNPHIIVVMGGRRPKHEKVGEREPRYRTAEWWLVGTGGTFVAVGSAFALLARDRQNALEAAAGDSIDNEPVGRFRWDFEGIRDLESQGKSYATLGKVFFGLGLAAGAAAGALWYLDYRYVHTKEAQVLPMSRLRLTPVGIEGEF